VPTYSKTVCSGSRNFEGELVCSCFRSVFFRLLRLWAAGCFLFRCSLCTEPRLSRISKKVSQMKEGENKDTSLISLSLSGYLTPGVEKKEIERGYFQTIPSLALIPPMMGNMTINMTRTTKMGIPIRKKQRTPETRL